MKKMKVGILYGISILSIINFTNATEIDKNAVRNGDSVMAPGTMTKPTLTTVNKKQGSTNEYSPNQNIEYSSSTCPVGYSNGGNSAFRTGQRLITSFYTNGQLMKTTTGDWISVNESCAGTEEQTINCPTGYTGNIKQQRPVTYNTSGYNYGGWSDISNSCSLIPPVTPPAPVNCSTQSTYVVTSRDYQEYDYAFTCVYDIYKEVSVNGMCKNTLIGSDSWVQYGGWFNCDGPLTTTPVTPPESTSRSWYQNSDWSEFDAYAYSGASKAYYDCSTAYGTANIIIYYGTGGNGRPDQGIPEYQKAVAPGGACYCDERSPNGAYIASGIGGDYSWRQEYLCLTNKQIQEYEDFKYGR